MRVRVGVFPGAVAGEGAVAAAGGAAAATANERDGHRDESDGDQRQDYQRREVHPISPPATR